MHFETRPLPAVGVELRGLDLVEAATGLADADFARLRQAVVDAGLVLVREQRLSPDAQVALGRRFGALEPMDLARDGSAPPIGVLGNVDADGRTLTDDDPRMQLLKINERWHTDSAFREVPASFSIFAAVVLPASGGDTFFASLERGWSALPPAERSELPALIGLHDYRSAYRREEGAGIDFDSPARRHPLVRRHPESGRLALYVAEHMTGIEGWSEDRGRALVARLVGVCTRPERVYRHRWQPGDVLIWDNRSMIHRAEGFDARHPRVMRHVRVAGEAPIPATG